MRDPADAVEHVLAYHERTKHQPHGFAAGPGHLDWATQPDPFRRFAGSALVRLPLLPLAQTPRYGALFEPGGVAPRQVTAETLSRVLRAAMGLTAWKRAGASRWALRANPSSGNLHPTEAYLVVGDGAAGLEAGVYHYAPALHALERRACLDAGATRDLLAPLPPGSLLLALTSIPWREAWKYGERALRYCLHDTGHAVASVRLAAALVGWRALALETVGDDEIARLVGLDRDDAAHEGEAEVPELLLAVVPADARCDAPDLDAAALARVVAGARWEGAANALSPDHRAWPAVEQGAHASAKPRTLPAAAPPTDVVAPRVLAALAGDAWPAERVVRQRRSAVGFDAATPLAREAFFRMLGRTMPGAAPFDALPSLERRARVHLALFVHRVSGLAPGLYLLARDAADLADLRAAMSASFAWSAVEGCPAGLPLFCLGHGDLRALAARVSCGQAIAADGAFSLGMLADVEGALSGGQAWAYRRLFWEAGAIGQVLYLEAEAAGVRGTGIGCYFDDAVHSLLGLRDARWQSLYHFTVGAPLDDGRIETEPPYDDERTETEPPYDDEGGGAAR